MDSTEIEAIAKKAANDALQKAKGEPEGSACIFEGYITQDGTIRLLTVSEHCKKVGIESASDKGIEIEYIDPKKLAEEARSKEAKPATSCTPCDQARDRLIKKLEELRAKQQAGG